MKTVQYPKKANQGFTLIEMIGVLAVIAILASLLLPKVFQAISDAKVNNAAVSIDTIRTATTDHYARFGSLLTSNNVAFSVPAANFDTVLLGEGIIDKPFVVRIGDGTNSVNNTRVQAVASAAAAVAGVGAGYSFDGTSTANQIPTGLTIIVGGSSKGDLLWEQNETRSKRELAEHIGPAVFGWFRWCGDDPELASWMVDDGDGMTLGGPDGPAAAEEVDLVICVETAREVEGEMKVQKTGIGAGTHGIALLGDRLRPRIVGGETSRSANSLVLLLQFLIEEFLGRGVVVDAFEGQQGQKALLKGAEATFDFAFGLRAWSHEM